MLALVCLVAFARPAQAHAVLQETSPGFDEIVDEQPERVISNFSEPVEINFGALRVFDSNGERVDADDSDHIDGDPASIAVGLQPDLADGTYTAAYRVISADSHVITGAFVWHIGAPGANAEGIGDELLSGEGGSGRLEGVLLGVARWTNFTGLLLLAKGKELSPGHYVVEGNQLSIPGEWVLTFKGRVDMFTQVDAETTVELER